MQPLALPANINVKNEHEYEADSANMTQTGEIGK